MITTKLARKMRTKKEQRHLTESGINSMKKLRNQIEFMKKMCPKFPASVCFDCSRIARKLKIN